MNNAVNIADAQLRALNVAHDRYVLAVLHRRLADDLDEARAIGRRTVREIEAKDIDA